MNFEKLIARARGVVSTPLTEWPVIASESTTPGDLYRDYVVVLSALGPVAGFVSSALFGVRVPLLGTLRPGIVSLVEQLVLAYGMSLVMTYVVALIIDWFAPQFGGQKDRVQALKTAAYSYTPVWIAGALRIVPGFGFLAGLAGLAAAVYAAYLLATGLPFTMKCPPERARGYAAGVIVAAFVLSLIVGGVTASVVGINRLTGDRAVVDSDGSLKADPSSPLGKLEAWSAKMEEASRKMEAAQKSGDSKAQSDALGQMLGTVLGGGDVVEALAPDRLKPFLPETLAGFTRSELSVERNAALGMQVSEAKASYRDGSNHTFHVEITDMGSAKGILAFAGWAALEQERETDQGYERTLKRDDRLVHERWNRSSESGEYGVIVGNRFSVSVSGKAEGIEGLRSLLESLDLAGLEALKGEGVKKGG